MYIGYTCIYALSKDVFIFCKTWLCIVPSYVYGIYGNVRLSSLFLRWMFCIDHSRTMLIILLLTIQNVYKSGLGILKNTCNGDLSQT